MAEQVYGAEWWDKKKRRWGKSLRLQFSDDLFRGDDEYWTCLCGGIGDKWGVQTLRSLALLGAAVVLAHEGEIDSGILPHCVPAHIRNKIKELLPDEKE